MKTIPAKSILQKNKSGAWFGNDYNMNLYKGCCHGCIYCDSRSDCYNIDNFDEVRAKENALEILRDELKRRTPKRNPRKKSSRSKFFKRRKTLGGRRNVRFKQSAKSVVRRCHCHFQQKRLFCGNFAKNVDVPRNKRTFRYNRDPPR